MEEHAALTAERARTLLSYNKKTGARAQREYLKAKRRLHAGCTI